MRGALARARDVLVDRLDGYEAMTIDASGAMRATPAFAFVRDGSTTR